MPNKPLLIAVMGPTASGKTAFAIELAKKHKAEIFSADSRQFYQELNIGVAKPTLKELHEVKHHFIGHISIHENYSAGQFEKDLMASLNTYFFNNEVAILVGGSGLFLKAAIEGLDDFPSIDANVRENLNMQLKSKGLIYLQEELKRLDPKSFNTLEIDNQRRVIRALEICLSSGKPYSDFINANKQERIFDVKKMALKWEREALYNRINQRVDDMVEMGLEAEARQFYSYKELNALNTVGYSEFFKYFEGKWSKDFAINKIKQHTRNFAKRQMTWLRKEEGLEWIEMS